MLMVFQRFSFAAAMFLVSLVPALAAITPPSGWASENDQGALVFTSPGGPSNQRVLYTVLPVESSEKAIEFWFDDRAPVLLSRLGTVGAQGQARGMGDYMMQIAAIKTANGVDARVVLIGYETIQGNQMLLILIPSQIADGDARVTAAFKHGQTLARQGQAHYGVVTQPMVTPPPATQP